MAVTPNTVVHFLNVPLENNYKNQIYFADRSKQTSFMLTKRVKSVSGNPLTWQNLTYQRKDNIIRVPMHIDELVNANYVMYQNTGYTDRWFYAFITKMEYVNEGRTDVYIETDVWQTWFDKITLKESFVEREHVTNDVAGNHTVPELLETGEYICNGLSRDNELSDLVYVVMTTEFLNADIDDPDRNKPLATNFGGIFYAGGAYVCPDMNTVVNIIQGMPNDECIYAVYMIPKKIIVDSEPSDLKFDGQADPVVYEHSFAKQTTLDGYTPKNKKLLCYPYNYILNSNNAGTSNVLQYELFEGDTCKFEIVGAPVIGGSIKCTPKNYKRIDRIQEEGIMCGKFPTLSWSSDLFTNWMTQNGVNIALGLASGIGQMVVGAGITLAGGGVAGGAVGGQQFVGGLTQVVNTIGQVYQQSMTPNSAKGNVNSGDINTCYDMNKFYFYKMSIKAEYARIIDNFFEKYGYKVNRVKVPELNTRPHWNYIKTIEVNLDGKCPQEDLKKIRMMFDNGVTFWSNGNNVENYSLNNH